MAYFYERRDRPGVHPVIGSLRGTATSGTSTGGGGGGDTPTAGKLTLSDEGVLIYTGAAPKMDGTVLVFTPTPTMADTVMTLS